MERSAGTAGTPLIADAYADPAVGLAAGRQLSRHRHRPCHGVSHCRGCGVRHTHVRNLWFGRIDARQRAVLAPSRPGAATLGVLGADLQLAGGSGSQALDGGGGFRRGMIGEGRGVLVSSGGSPVAVGVPAQGVQLGQAADFNEAVVIRAVVNIGGLRSRAARPVPVPGQPASAG